MSHQSVSQECPLRVSYRSIPQECPTRVSHKSVLQECPARVTHKSVPQEFPARVTHKSVPQECPTRVSQKSVPQECPTRVSFGHISFSNVFAFGFVGSILFTFFFASIQCLLVHGETDHQVQVLISSIIRSSPLFGDDVVPQYLQSQTLLTLNRCCHYRTDENATWNIQKVLVV